MSSGYQHEPSKEPLYNIAGATSVLRQVTWSQDKKLTCAMSHTQTHAHTKKKFIQAILRRCTYLNKNDDFVPCPALFNEAACCSRILFLSLVSVLALNCKHKQLNVKLNKQVSVQTPHEIVHLFISTLLHSPTNLLRYPVVALRH